VSGLPEIGLRVERQFRLQRLEGRDHEAHTPGGQNMTPKRPRDPNQLAKSIIDIATGQKPDRDPTPEEQGKDPAAVALGKKGGKARADSLTAEKRSEIAKRAAQKRWGED
jgi:hypothetical protein